MIESDLVRLGLEKRVGLVCLIYLAACAASLSADEPAADVADVAKWQQLLVGKSLAAWENVAQDNFEKHGLTDVREGGLTLKSGDPATGVRWTGAFPAKDYEISFDARRVEGEDFFCGLTFPVGDSGLTLILGGWSGWVVGLSCIDGRYAINNDTCRGIEFQQNRWYRVRVRVTEPKVEVWLDDKQIIVLETAGKKLSVSEEMEPCRPLGIATWRTTGALRNVRYRILTPTPPE